MIPLQSSGLYPSEGNLVGLQGEAYFGKKNPKLYPCVIRALNSDGTIKVQWEGGTFTERLPQSKFYILEEGDGSTMSENQNYGADSVSKQIRAIYDTSTVRVYQAYNDEIADAAIAAQSFQGPLDLGIWSKTRMTWIKPSKVWMAYRCGFTVLKDKNQTRVLALDISRSKFEELLQQAQLSSHNKGKKNGTKKCRDCSVVVQWDPERIMACGSKTTYTASVPSVRSIQIGLRGSAVEALLDPNVVIRISDVTQDFRSALEALKEDNLEKAKEMLWPEEKEYEMNVPPDIQKGLEMTTTNNNDNSSTKDAVVVLGSACNPPHQGHFYCLQAGKQKAEEMGYRVLFTTVAAAPQGYCQSKIMKQQQENNHASKAIVFSDETRLSLLGVLAGSDIGNKICFRCPDRCYGSALECGRRMRDSDDVTVFVVVGGDRSKSKWRKKPKQADRATVCCARDETQLNFLEKSYANDKKEGLVLDEKYFFAEGVGPTISSTQIRSILSKNSPDKIVSKLVSHGGYAEEAAEFLRDQYRTMTS